MTIGGGELVAGIIKTFLNQWLITLASICFREASIRFREVPLSGEFVDPYVDQPLWDEETYAPCQQCGGITPRWDLDEGVCTDCWDGNEL